MKDHRQFLRKALHCTVSVFDEQHNSLGVMADYSDGGIMLSSYQAIEVDKNFKLTIIDLPGNSGHKRSGHIEVLSVWCDKVNTSQFGTGFKLIKCDENANIMFQSYDNSQN